MIKGFWFYFNFIPFVLGILFILMFIMNSQSSDHSGLSYIHNECAGLNETDLDSEGWSAMDFCVDEKASRDLAYALLLFIPGIIGIIFIIPLAVYLLLSRKKCKHGHY